MSIIIAFLVFETIILVHEIGHYVAAVKCGVLVEEFAIGMGPKLFGIKRGETLFSIRILPFGGFCKMLGDEGETKGNDRNLYAKPVLQRIIIISAGVIMNFILAFIIFTALTMVNGYVEPVVATVIEGSAAETVQLKEGDIIREINGSRINIYEDLSFALSENKGEPIELTISRDGQRIRKVLTPQKNEEGRYLIGFRCLGKAGIFGELPKDVEGIKRASLISCLINGFWQILFWIKLTFTGIIKLLTFQLGTAEMSGPIGIVGEINRAYSATIVESISYTIQTMARFVAILSANLGVMNLLPLPALDGGRLIFLFIEGIRRKPIAPEKEGMIHFIGFVLLMVLAVFIAFNDVTKLI